MWSVGDIMQARYAKRTGRQPVKDNRPKTHGRGSHCFALYPDDYFEEIAEEIKKFEYIRTKQIDLF
jgi:hypothetical protein